MKAINLKRSHCPKCESKNIIQIDWATYEIETHPDWNGLLHFRGIEPTLPDYYCFGCHYYWMDGEPNDGHSGGMKIAIPKNGCLLSIL